MSALTIRLQRQDNSPWGFRLQGGKDFGQPLLIQKVNGGSIAERAGLQVGDALIRVNGVEVAESRHKEAQDTIIKGGNSLELAVQRGGQNTWRPQVSPVGQVPLPGKASPATTVTRTSLAATGKSPAPIGAGHNLSPKPFGTTLQMNGEPGVKALVNKQYNTPVNIYSEDVIAETLSAQAEVIAGGAIGVNFKKNEKTYDATKSEVLKMVQEVEKEPKEPDTPDGAGTGVIGSSSSSIGFGGLRHVQPPEPRPTPASPQPQQLPPGQNICADCERLIVGVFVRIKDKNLHVECFKCATCGTSLKNVGYYNINNKLYCDIHAKMVARQNPPAANLEPVTVPPGGRAPLGAFTSPLSSSAPAPGSPQPGTLAPLPFHAPRTTTSHVTTPWYGRQTSAPSGPKPFSSVTAPCPPPASVSFTPAPAPPPAPQLQQHVAPPTPFSSVSQPTSFSKPSDSATPIVWPPSSQSHLSTSQLSKVEEKRMSICSQEVSTIASRKVEMTGSVVAEERPLSPVPNRAENLKAMEKAVIEAGERVRSRSASPLPPRSRSPRPVSPRPVSPRPMTPRSLRVDPELLDISSKPHGVYSLIPPASVIRPLSPQQVVVFPPELPTVIYSRSPTPQAQAERSVAAQERCTTCPSPLNALVPYQPKPEARSSGKEEVKPQAKSSGPQTEKKSDVKKDKVETKSCKLEVRKDKQETKKEREIREKEESYKKKMYFTRSEVEEIIQKEVVRALSQKEENEAADEKIEEEISVYDLPKPLEPGGWITSALTTASDRPFTPVSFPKPLELPSVAERIIPISPIEIKREDKPVALPEETQPYFPPPPPPPESEARDERVARALREVGCRSPLTEALTIAPVRPYSPLPAQPQSAFRPVQASNKKQMSMASAVTTAPTVPFTIPGKTPIPYTEACKEMEQKHSSFRPVVPSFLQEKEQYGVDLNRIAIGTHARETAKLIESGKFISKSSREGKSISPVPQPSIATTTKPLEPWIPEMNKPKQVKQTCHKESQESKEKVELVQTTTVPGRALTPAGLHPPQELPYYQQNIGIIPVRNKSVSPIPHIIKAPQLEPTPQMTQGYKTTTFSETKTYSAQKSSMQMLSKTDRQTTTTKKEQVVAGAELSPGWKVETKRTVQNLSPITVRLPSPRPVTPVQGDTTQLANAKIEIHKPRPSSPLPPKIKVQVDYPTVPSSTAPSIGSEKSAFVSVKNGSSVSKKPSESCSKSQCSDVCERKACDSKSCRKVDCCQKSKTKESASSAKEMSTTAMEVMEQKQAIQEKSSKISSFRVYGQTTSKTLSSEEHRASGKKEKVKIEPAVQSKTYVEEEGSKRNGSSGQSKTSSTAHRTTSQAGASSTNVVAKQQSDSSKSCRVEERGVKAVSSSQSSVSSMEQKRSEVCTLASQRTSVQEKQLDECKKWTSQTRQSEESLRLGRSPRNPFPGPAPLAPLALPTFPSLPHLSDVSRTLGGGVGGPAGRTGTLAGSSAPRRGRGILNPQVAPGARIPLCGSCNRQIRGPFITALGKIWCPEHFVCVNAKCRRPLQDIGFVEEQDGLYCEFCFEQYLAPVCDKCRSKIKGDCLNAIGKHFHPECFACAYCGKLFGNNPFFLEDALPYCENDWNELFTTKCFSCGFPIEAGDRWVEALNNNYHSQCFNCTMCKKNLEGQSFFAKAGRPFCKNHAR